MAKLKVKGTVLEQGSGTTFTAVAQVTGFSITGMETETYDADTGALHKAQMVWNLLASLELELRREAGWAKATATGAQT